MAFYPHQDRLYCCMEDHRGLEKLVGAEGKKTYI